MSGRSLAHDDEGDDFTRISGIGKARDRRLHQAGVNSYADLAALNPEGIASLLAGDIAVRPERISDEQAAKLAEEAEEAEEAAEAGPPPVAGETGHVTLAPPVVQVSRPVPSASDGTGQHYQSFVVRILLHELDGRIASTTVQHVGSGTERRWPGLDEPALLEFISAHLPTEMPAPDSPGEEAVSPEAEPVTEAAPAEAAPAGEASAGEASAGAAHAEAAAHFEAAAHAEAVARLAAEKPVPPVPVPPPPGSSLTSGEVSLRLGKEPRVPRSCEPFTVSITLDLTDVEPSPESRVGFTALVLARPLGEAAPQVVSEGKGIVPAAAPLITLHSPGLPAGSYRLEAVVELIEPHGGSRDLVTSMEGGILVVSGSGAEPSPVKQLQRVP